MPEELDHELQELMDLEEGSEIVGAKKESGNQEENQNQEEQNNEDQNEENQEQENGNQNEKPFDFGQHFGEYDSVEKITGLINSHKTVLNQVQSFESEKEKLSTKIKELEGRNPFNDERYYKVDKISKEDPEKAALLSKFAFGSLSDAELIKLEMAHKHKDIFDKNPGALERKFQKKYSALFDEEIEKDSDEYEEAKVDLALDAKEVRQRLQADLDGIDLPENKVKTEEEIQQERTEFVNNWKPEFGKITESFSKFEIPMLNEKGEVSVFHSLDLDKDQQKVLAKHAADFVLGNGLEPNQDNIEKAKEYALGMYLISNFSEISTKLANHIIKDQGQEWSKRYSNASKADSDVHRNRGGKKTPESGSEEEQLKALGLDGGDGYV